MLLIRDIFNSPHVAQGCAVAIGNFDGCHLGHQEVLKATNEIAEAAGIKSAVLSFEPHPRSFFGRDNHAFRVQNFRAKYESLKNSGIDVFYAIRFNQDLSKTSAEDFIKGYLVEAISARHVITGSDFVFGKDRAGSAALLQAYSANIGSFRYSDIPEVGHGDKKISSTTLRKYIAEGRMPEAADIMGRSYSISGRVIKGDGIGTTLGFPTANINYPKNIILPAFGVYNCMAVIDGVRYKAAVNLGMRPTVSGKKLQLEGHLPEFSGNLYGKRICFEFINKVREEIVFSSVNELITQIKADVESII